MIRRSSITSPIIGPRSLDQLDDNLGALAFELPSDMSDELDRASDWRIP
jgi:aryl-alcohol dehydrogenase-like predicted oxidoreductase